MEAVQERKAELRMRATVPPCLGFAMAKNGLPLVEELLVENLGEAPLEGAWLRMEFSEALASTAWSRGRACPCAPCRCAWTPAIWPSAPRARRLG